MKENSARKLKTETSTKMLSSKKLVKSSSLKKLEKESSLIKVPSVQFIEPILSQRRKVQPRKYQNFAKIKERPIEKMDVLPPILP